MRTFLCIYYRGCFYCNTNTLQIRRKTNHRTKNRLPILQQIQGFQPSVDFLHHSFFKRISYQSILELLPTNRPKTELCVSFWNTSFVYNQTFPRRRKGTNSWGYQRIRSTLMNFPSTNQRSEAVLLSAALMASKEMKTWELWWIECGDINSVIECYWLFMCVCRY